MEFVVMTTVPFSWDQNGENQPLLNINRGSTDDESDKFHDRRFELNHPSAREEYTPLFTNDGHINILKKGILNLQQIYVGDPFHTIVNSPWRRVFVIISVVYLFIWILFALGYFMCLEFDDECLGNAHLIGGSHGPLERFFVGFFFSVQTQMTIGYGNNPPQNYFSSFLFVIQSLAGLLMEAVCIGIVYAKFGRPTTRVSSIKFSKKAIIGNRDGKRSFYFRFVDIRKHQLCEPHIRVYLATNEETIEGEKYVNFKLLTTNYGENYLVFLGGYPCVIAHEIDDESPLRNEEVLRNAEILIIFEGVDATTASTIQARYSYQLKDIEFNVRYANIVTHKTDGLVVDFTLFDNTVPI